MNAIVATVSALAFVVLLVFFLGRTDEDTESAFDAALRPAPPTPPAEPASLTAARWLVVNATTAGGLHFRVRPAIVGLSVARLRDRDGIGLSLPRAPGLLGDELWAVVRPDAPAPDDRMAPGLSPSTFRSLLDRLEAL
jgi:hypothetical protein